MARPVTSLGSLRLPANTARHRVELSGEAIGIARLADSAMVGRAEVAVEDGILELRSVCIDESERGYGAGTDAVRLLLEAASAACHTAKAFAPPDNGLAVYFWTRMGFSPRFGSDPRGLRFERKLE